MSSPVFQKWRDILYSDPLFPLCKMYPLDRWWGNISNLDKFTDHRSEVRWFVPLSSPAPIIKARESSLITTLKQEYIPVGCILSAAVIILGSVCASAWGCLPLGGWECVCLPRAVCAQERVSAQGGVCLGGCTPPRPRGRHTPHGQNDRQV